VLYVGARLTLLFRGAEAATLKLLALFSGALLVRANPAPGLSEEILVNPLLAVPHEILSMSVPVSFTPNRNATPLLSASVLLVVTSGAILMVANALFAHK
jgi:hypothetical protein